MKGKIAWLKIWNDSDYGIDICEIEPSSWGDYQIKKIVYFEVENDS